MLWRETGYPREAAPEHADQLKEPVDEKVRWPKPVVLTSVRQLVGKEPVPSIAHESRLDYNDVADGDCADSTPAPDGEVIQVGGSRGGDDSFCPLGAEHPSKDMPKQVRGCSP